MATTAKKSTKKSAPKKSAAKKSSASKRAGSDQSSANRSAPRAESTPRASAGQVASAAARQLLELTGKEALGVTGLKRTDDGWNVQVEVVELRRIPETTDVLALYEVSTDSRGELEGYRRLRRYVRGAPGDE